jgi:hypothetical protein
MDEWFEDGREVPVTHPLSFERADRELCFDRIRPDLRMPEANLHFPKADSAVPMSLLADHPNVQFNYFRGGLGSCAVEMH